MLYFTSINEIIVDFVNLVKYKIYMNSNNSIKNPENKEQITQEEDTKQNSQTGVYLRDDHCDWGSSGMNEFTNEYGESK